MNENATPAADQYAQSHPNDIMQWSVARDGATVTVVYHTREDETVYADDDIARREFVNAVIALTDPDWDGNWGVESL